MKPFNKTFVVEVQNKALKWTTATQEALWRYALKQLEGKKVWIELSTKEPTRSAKQNALLWLYYEVIADETGHSKDDIHTWAKGKFLSQGITEVFGSKVRKTKSTTGLSKNDFSEYLLNIEAECGVPIPDVRLFNEWKDSAPSQGETYEKDFS